MKDFVPLQVAELVIIILKKIDIQKQKRKEVVISVRYSDSLRKWYYFFNQTQRVKYNFTGLVVGQALYKPWKRDGSETSWDKA